MHCSLYLIARCPANVLQLLTVQPSDYPCCDSCPASGSCAALAAELLAAPSEACASALAGSDLSVAFVWLSGGIQAVEFPFGSGCQEYCALTLESTDITAGLHCPAIAHTCCARLPHSSCNLALTLVSSRIFLSCTERRASTSLCMACAALWCCSRDMIVQSCCAIFFSSWSASLMYGTKANWLLGAAMRMGMLTSASAEKRHLLQLSNTFCIRLCMQAHFVRMLLRHGGTQSDGRSISM